MTEAPIGATARVCGGSAHTLSSTIHGCWLVASLGMRARLTRSSISVVRSYQTTRELSTEPCSFPLVLNNEARL